MKVLDAFDPLAAEIIECPYEFHEQLRRGPVYKDPKMDLFIVGRYEDCLNVLNNEDVFSSRTPQMVTTVPSEDDSPGPISERYPGETELWNVETLINNDPPSHTRYRVLATKAFSRRYVQQLEAMIRSTSNQLIDGFIGAGSVELVSQFAKVMPLLVFCDVVGVPREDAPTLERWFDDAIDTLGGMISWERRRECAASAVALQSYFVGWIKKRRGEPRDDFLTYLVNSRLEGTEPLSEPEIVGLVLQLIDPSTANLISSGMMLMTQHPDQMEAVRADRSLVPNMVEEVLRLESPVQALFRVAKIDAEIAGTKIPAGSRLAVMYGAANRDPAQFPEPDRFDVRRANVNSHLAFSRGIHYCPGAPLARLEARVGFEVLFSRLRNIRLADANELRHTPSFVVRGLKELHLEFAS